MHINNGAELGGATGAMAPLVFWSRSIKKSRKVSKSKSRSLEWHQLFLPSFGANENTIKIIDVPTYLGINIWTFTISRRYSTKQASVC